LVDDAASHIEHSQPAAVGSLAASVTWIGVRAWGSGSQGVVVAEVFVVLVVAAVPAADVVEAGDEVDAGDPFDLCWVS
jgi:hypothetical protein